MAYQKLRTNRETFELIFGLQILYAMIAYAHNAYEYGSALPHWYRYWSDVSFYVLSAFWAVLTPIALIAATIRAIFWKDVGAAEGRAESNK